jgi:hypothetical protein
MITSTMSDIIKKEVDLGDLSGKVFDICYFSKIPTISSTSVTRELERREVYTTQEKVSSVLGELVSKDLLLEGEGRYFRVPDIPL